MNPTSQSSALKSETSKSPGGEAIESSIHGTLEVVPKAKRRTFTAEYKARILREAEAAAGTRGAVGELLRREGLYSSHLAEWRRDAKRGALKALAKKRGRRPRSIESRENEQLRRRVAQLEDKLRQAEIIIDVQKKVATLLGVPLATGPEEDA
jgi:transposase-like protein